MVPIYPSNDAFGPAGPRSSPIRTGTVLLVEDEESVRHMLGLVLRRAGFRVLEAQSGSQALGLCRSHHGPIDLLLTDALVVPTGGRQLMEGVAQLRRDVRVLCISGYPRETLIAEGLLDGDVAFLQKPFTAAVLKQQIGRLLDC